jgi:hypothetical protein
MTYAEANKLLDHVKDGTRYPTEVISEALAMTGDGDHATQLPCPEIDDFVQALKQSGAL